MGNVRNFDNEAALWDEKPERVKLARDIANAMMEKLPLSDSWDAVDFGCGTGLVTLLLSPQLRSICGVDSSNGMLSQLEAKVERFGDKNVTSMDVDTFITFRSEKRFDLIVSAMTLHHIEKISELFSMFHSRLKPGGMVALADLESEDGTFHADPTGVFHHGFSREELTKLLVETGFRTVTVSQVAEVVKGDRVFPVIMAVAFA